MGRKFKTKVRILEWNEYEVEVYAEDEAHLAKIIKEKGDDAKKFPYINCKVGVAPKPSASLATVTHAQLASAEENTHWLVVQSVDANGIGGKYDDGWYGWDGMIHSPEQIHAEDDLPYEPNDGMRFITVGLTSKPSVEEVREKLAIMFPNE